MLTFAVESLQRTRLFGNQMAHETRRRDAVADQAILF
jgi:hypothetical protein